MKNVRIWFEKTGSARFISHLDLTRCMSRALKLSGLPVWYTEGFNPRIYMTYAMPLSLGVRGERECMDIRLTAETDLSQVPDRLNRRLPRDILVQEAAEPVEKLESIGFAEYEVFLEEGPGPGLQEPVARLLGRKEIPVRKHGKKGDKEVDIKPYFAELKMDCPQPGVLRLAFRLPCSVSGSVNPSLLLDALRDYEGEEPYAQIVRKRLLLPDLSELR